MAIKENTQYRIKGVEDQILIADYCRTYNIPIAEQLVREATDKEIYHNNWFYKTKYKCMHGNRNGESGCDTIEDVYTFLGLNQTFEIWV